MSEIKDRFADLVGRSSVTQISLNKVLGIHPQVPRSLVDAHPCRLGDPRKLDLVSICWLLMAMPLVVAPSTGKKDGYWVIGSFYTWQLLSLIKSAVEDSKRKQQNLHLPESIFAVHISGEIQAATVDRLAACDTWLRLISLPVASVADAVSVRLHAQVGTALLKELTPGLSSVRKLATHLGHKSHTAIAALAIKQDLTATEVANEEVEHDSP